MPIMSIAAASIAVTIRCANLTATKTENASDNIAIGWPASWIKAGHGGIELLQLGGHAGVGCGVSGCRPVSGRMGKREHFAFLVKRSAFLLV